jgi:hypothetical protein
MSPTSTANSRGWLVTFTIIRAQVLLNCLRLNATRKPNSLENRIGIKVTGAWLRRQRPDRSAL